ncbi:VOC family protein [Lentibacillus jeotgali]|uniref:VOC family protein n=1 Tax=Lentibacillus jeotgali TaxID=558169 RepID=UPI000262640C|nr:VOC family protein [Lentibacillus jeotgali]
MRIKITSVFVEDQEKALQFYTEVLGFQKKMDMPAGDFKWLTVVSPEEPDGVELLLEPNENDAAKTYQKTIYEEGIPSTSFVVDDIHAEYDRLKRQGVEFSMEPTETGPITFAIFDDTCGNLIQISQAR